VTVQHRLAREDSVVPSEKDKSEEQKAAVSEVESFRKDLGPFVVAAETIRMAMVFTDAKESNHPLIFANDSFLQLPQQHDMHDRVAALSKMSGIGHIARLLRYKGAACGSGPVAMSKDRRCA
jgi:hypothetical protein